jgi:aminopeptidase N
MRISVLVPYGLQDISNGKFLGASDNFDGYNQFNWKVDYPINLYDVTLNVGDYRTLHDTFNSTAGAISLDYYVLPEHVKKAESYFDEQVKPMLRSFEHYFGPYPFTKDGYALVDDPYWGMEHQSAIAYGNHFKLNNYGFDFIIVHESAHEWWGNSLSVPDDSLMWLHESFATYAESLYLEYNKGKNTALSYLIMQRKLIKNKIPMLHPKPDDSATRSDNDIYYKGAWMLHTLRNSINNDKIWFSILKEFQQKYKYSFVTTKDFVSLVNSMTRYNYDGFFKQYLEDTSLPVFECSISGNGKRRELSYQWKADAPGFSMPITIWVGDRMLRLDADTGKKKISLEEYPGNVRVDRDYFYVEVKNENP